LPKKEALKLGKELVRLNRMIGGIKEMTILPSALFIVDVTKERLALEEAKRVGIPVVAVADTNCDPTGIDYPIPANDDAIKAIKLACSRIADSVLAGKAGGGEFMVREEQPEGESIAEVVVAEDTEPVVFMSGDE